MPVRYAQIEEIRMRKDIAKMGEAVAEDKWFHVISSEKLLIDVRAAYAAYCRCFSGAVRQNILEINLMFPCR